MNDNDHENCGCGCDSGDFESLDHDAADAPMLKLELDDGSVINCSILGNFEMNDISYIALVPEDEDEILLYRSEELDSGFKLDNIESEDEYELVAERFFELFSDEFEIGDDDDDDDEYEFEIDDDEIEDEDED